MKFAHFILVAVVCLQVHSCSKGVQSPAPLERASSIQLNRLAGEWNVLARIPTLLDRNAVNMIVQIEVKNSEKLNLVWTFKSDASTTTDTRYNLTATTTPGVSTELRLSPFWPLNLNVYVVEYSGDYSWVLFGSPDRRYVWLLSKGALVDSSLFAAILKRIEGMEFDMTEVVPKVSSI